MKKLTLTALFCLFVFVGCASTNSVSRLAQPLAGAGQNEVELVGPVAAPAPRSLDMEAVTPISFGAVTVQIAVAGAGQKSLCETVWESSPLEKRDFQKDGRTYSFLPVAEISYLRVVNLVARVTRVSVNVVDGRIMVHVTREGEETVSWNLGSHRAFQGQTFSSENVRVARLDEEFFLVLAKTADDLTYAKCVSVPSH